MQHFDEGQGVFGQVDLAAEQRHSRSVELRISNHFEGVVAGPGTAAQDAHDQPGVILHQFAQRFRPVVSNFKKNRTPAFRDAGQRANDVVIDKGRNLSCGNAGLDVGLKTSRK